MVHIESLTVCACFDSNGMCRHRPLETGADRCRCRGEIARNAVVDNAKKIFRLAIFYRKIARKITFDFEDPGNPAERTF